MNITLAEYFDGVQHRLPAEAERVIRALYDEGPMNKEELSLTSRVKRAVLDHRRQEQDVQFDQVRT